jgi:hypothetical protein
LKSTKRALSVPVIVPSALIVGRVDADAEILAARVAARRQRVASERTGELDRIAVRPVERADDGVLLLCKLELQPEMLDRERPGACD